MTKVRDREPKRTEMRDRSYLRNPLKRMIHDEGPHVMYLADIDMALYRRLSRILRIVEIKHRGEELRPSQEAILPLLARSLQLARGVNRIAESSGVFVVRWNEGELSVEVTEVCADRRQKASCYEIPIDEFLEKWATCKR